MKQKHLALAFLFTIMPAMKAQSDYFQMKATSKSDFSNVTDYDIEMDFEIKEVAAGPCFAAKDASNFFMWQINIETGRTVFRPHSWFNGGGACHAEVDITSIIDIQKGVVYELKIEVRGDKATTYINNILIDQNRTNPRGGNYGFANLGFRQDKAQHSATLEETYYDNIIVKVQIGENIQTLFDENFSSPINFLFSGGNVVDGRLLLIGRKLYWQIPPALYTTYTLEMDFEINDLAAGPCFAAKDGSNYYMWQINIEGGRSYFRPHSWENGGGACHEEKDISSLIVIQKDVTYRLRIEINNEKASTYINDILVDANRVNPRGNRIYGYSKLGFRASHNANNVGEKAYYDNISLSTVINEITKTLFSDNFSGTENPFTEGEIIDGRLYVGSTGGDFYSWQKNVAEVVTAVQSSEVSESYFTIHPNPVKDVLVISNQVEPYLIFDFTGKQLQAGREATVNVSGLEPGVYLIRIGTKIAKFMKY
jgi:hypothetical protein